MCVCVCVWGGVFDLNCVVVEAVCVRAYVCVCEQCGVTLALCGSRCCVWVGACGLVCLHSQLPS